MKPGPVDEPYQLSATRTTIDHEDTTSETTPGHRCSNTYRGPRRTRGHARLMDIVERSTDTPPPPTSHSGMSRVDGCPECVLNVEPPYLSDAFVDGGYRNAYICSDCGRQWVTEWGS